MEYVAFAFVLVYLVAGLAVNVHEVIVDRSMSSFRATTWCFVIVLVYALLALSIHASAGLWS